MKRFWSSAAAIVGAVLAASASDVAVADSAQLSVSLENVEVIGTRASANTPVALTNVTAKDVEKLNQGLDMPMLLGGLPSALTTSDAGAGVGYTSLRIRGTDATRINVTINDIPINDAESHNVFWVDLPDVASSIKDIQVQRGVGTSTNGSGAFGASVNVRTQGFSLKPMAEFSGSYGSFNTNKQTVRVASGVLGDHWVAEGRLSHIGSDGYRDRASSELKSYFAQLGYFNDRTVVKFVSFGGWEDTYHAWDGISREQLTTERKYNPNGEIKHDGVVTGFYKDQKDIYKQIHYQLIWNQSFSPAWKLNFALHYTDGDGYYQEYKNRRTLQEYLLEPISTAEGIVKKSNLVRRKNLDAKFGGGVFALRYDGSRLNATLGGALNRYVNHHKGQVIWVENYTSTLEPDHQYYSNDGKKTDFNLYIKGNYAIWRGLSAYLDLQYRHIKYRIDGTNDKWDWTATPEHMQVLDVNETFNFFNPKAGINWQISAPHRVYASFAVAQKEPTRNNYTDGLFYKHPTSERLYDWEVGYEYRSRNVYAGVNLYYMNYHDQLLLNGKINEIGELMAENVPHSYRMGVELIAGWRITDWLKIDANATFSRNRIKDYVGYVSDYDAATWDELYTQTTINAGNTAIAFSPSAIVGASLTFDYKGFMAMFQSQYVSRQYLDNFENKEDSLDPYCVSNLLLSYGFALPHVKKIEVGVSIYNLFNKKYCTNGYSQTCALYDGSGNYTLYSDPRFYPMAGTNVLAHLTLRF